MYNMTLSIVHSCMEPRSVIESLREASHIDFTHKKRDCTFGGGGGGGVGGRDGSL